MPLGTYACSFVPDFAGTDAWKACAPPRAKAITIEALMAAETPESSLEELISRFQRSTRFSGALARRHLTQSWPPIQ